MARDHDGSGARETAWSARCFCAWSFWPALSRRDYCDVL